MINEGGKICMMKAQLRRHFDRLSALPEHYSHQRHRKQRNTQIILPVVFSVLLCVGMIVWIGFATFNSNGDVSRWAAISTIWIVVPVLIAGLIFLAILMGFIYLMARALGALPHYTGLAQDYVFKMRAIILRGSNLAVKPVLALNGWLEYIKAFLGRIMP